jgi:hypothetical protein
MAREGPGSSLGWEAWVMAELEESEKNQEALKAEQIKR